MKTKLLLFFAFITLGLTAQTTYNLGWSTDGGSNGQQLSIEVGDTVIWTWGADGMSHNLAQIGDISEPDFADTYFSEGHVYSHTFTTPGTHDYLCSPHPSTMNGIITVSEAAPPATAALSLQGIMDIDISGGVGKGVHLLATADIADLSVYALGSANNQQGTDGAEFTLPVVAVTSGQHILVTNSSSDATGTDVFLNTYMDASNLFDLVVNGAGGALQGNGNDAYELFMNDAVVETFGVTGNVGDSSQGSDYSMDWAYNDSWAYKVDGAWTYGGSNCTDGSATTWDSSCVYPFAIGQNPLGLDDVAVSEFTFFPNPVNNVLSIKAQASIDGITIFNMLGQAVVRSTPNTTDSTVDMSALQTGAYFVQVSINNTLKTVRVIKN